MRSRLFLWSVRSLVAAVLCLPLWLGYVYAAAPAPPDLVEVVATGMGIDANAALLNAYSNAVQQALGLYVDAETLVQNDQIVQDQILTYSKGFIETAQQISSSQGNGLFQVKIRAKVKREELMAKAKSSNITSVKATDGASIHAQMQSKEEQQQNAQALLEKAVAQFANTDMVRAELIGEPSVKEGEAGNTILTYQVLFSVDEAVYKKATGELMAVLDQIASKKMEIVGSTDAASRRNRNKPDFNFTEDGMFATTDYIRFNILTWHSRNFASFKSMRYDITNANKDMFGNFQQQMPTAHISLLDANGELLAAVQFALAMSGNRPLATITYELSKGIFVIKPYAIQLGYNKNRVRPKVLISIDVPIANEDLPSLKTAKIELKR